MMRRHLILYNTFHRNAFQKNVFSYFSRAINDRTIKFFPFKNIVVALVILSIANPSVKKNFFLSFQPQNIVMMSDYPNCEIKLCDFEISRVILEGKIIRELLGTPDYVGEKKN